MKITVIEINTEEMKANKRVADTIADALCEVCDSLFRNSSKNDYRYIEDEEAGDEG